MRFIDADELSQVVSSLSIFLAGENIFHPDAKESVLRLIDESPTISPSIASMLFRLENVRDILTPKAYENAYSLIVYGDSPDKAHRLICEYEGRKLEP